MPVNFTVTPTKMIEAYGLENVVFFPQYAEVEPRAGTLLSLVGLPHSDVFSSRIDPEDPYDAEFDPVALGSRFEHYGFPCPPESRSWWMLGNLFTSLIALDPESGKIYAFPEGEEGYIPLHRDVESFLFALIEFRKLEVDHDNETLEPEELSERFKQVVGEFDPTPFADEDSQWNLSLQELEDEMW
ncbi:SUKH-4 family immunity protein [Streptomyces sp. Q6]|uniref:SUKH-4 family immunity protein n=1 Tax=Streptomyces citrinus TaxID=3118173 RepID=A0ACD5A6X4_9ACTN